jgi:hypothetical protein
MSVLLRLKTANYRNFRCITVTVNSKQQFFPLLYPLWSLNQIYQKKEMWTQSKINQFIIWIIFISLPSLIFSINSCAKSAWYARRQHSYNICKDFLSHYSWMKNLNFPNSCTFYGISMQIIWIVPSSQT